MSVWRRQFVPGAEVVAADGWHGIVQKQDARHVVAIAVGIEANDDLLGYRDLVADNLISTGGGEWLDRRPPEQIVYAGRKHRCLLTWPQRIVWRGTPSRERAPSLGAQERPLGAPAKRRNLA